MGHKQDCAFESSLALDSLSSTIEGAPSVVTETSFDKSLWLQASSFSLVLIRCVICVRVRVFGVKMILEIWQLESIVGEVA